MTKQKELLKKYYKGESMLEEEEVLKNLADENADLKVEEDIFAYYKAMSQTPDDLDDFLTDAIPETPQGRKIRLPWLKIASVAAVFALVISLYLNTQNQKLNRMENDFMLMEEALFQVSEQLKPDPEQEDMLVLWVDDNVEIIIN